MANKKKPENGEDLIRQYLKDKAAGRSTFDEKSDFQKRESAPAKTSASLTISGKVKNKSPLFQKSLTP